MTLFVLSSLLCYHPPTFSFLPLLPTSWTETPGDSGWRGGERAGLLQGAPWVEHGHLSWGWKLKKRLVNLYSWFPRDGKEHSQAKHLQEKAERTCMCIHTHTHTCTDACMNGACGIVSRNRYLREAREVTVFTPPHHPPRLASPSA